MYEGLVLKLLYMKLIKHLLFISKWGEGQRKEIPPQATPLAITFTQTKERSVNRVSRALWGSNTYLAINAYLRQDDTVESAVD